MYYTAKVKADDAAREHKRMISTLHYHMLCNERQTLNRFPEPLLHVQTHRRAYIVCAMVAGPTIHSCTASAKPIALHPYLLRCADVAAELRVEWLVLHLALPTAVARHAAEAAAQTALQGEG
jgi:hypothetical protein